MSDPRPSMPEIEAFAAAVGCAQSVLFITGAGLSADSGLPTYRGIGGLYEAASTSDGLAIEVALSGPTMARDPALCWKYIAEIERACRGAQPNTGHLVIAQLEQRVPRVWVLTQNVDGLHGQAGSTRVIEIHGNLQRLRCVACSRVRVLESYAGLQLPPRCSACAGLERPDVVLFEEMLPAAAVRDLAREVRRGFDLVVSVGTQGTFPYIAEPVFRAAATGVTTVEIDPSETQVSAACGIRIRARAAPTFAALAAALEQR